jgi:hypothetical protein
VLAPVMASRAHHLASDVDRDRAEAQLRLEASLAWASDHRLYCEGEVGDPDPLVAIEDELRDAGAHELIVSGADFRKQFNTDAKIIAVVRSGSVIARAPIVSMPHWGGIIAPTQLRAVVAYLKTLK